MTDKMNAAGNDNVILDSSGATWLGMRVAGWTWEEDAFSPDQFPSENTVRLYASHWSTGPHNAERLYRESDVAALLSKLLAEGVQAGGLPAYINDDSQPLQYRLGWNNCLSDCRAALASAPVAGEAHTALSEWFDKTDFIQKRIASGELPVRYLGWHRADVMRDLIDGASRNQELASGCILVQETDTIPHTHPEYGPGIFFTEDARIEFDAAPQARTVAGEAHPVACGERVYAFRRKGLDDFVTCSQERFEELQAKPRLFETRILYASPVAPADVQPVAWMVDWPEEPDLGHTLLEDPVPGARNRALVIRDAAPQASETYTDEKGTVWTQPTAWAYAQVCKARDKWQAAASAPVAGEARGEDAAQMAGLESSINILSALVDHQRLLLVEVEDVCGRDVHGGPLEDGESDLIDRVRQHLAATIPAAQSAANTPVAEEAARIIKLPAVDSALATFIENSDGNTALVLVQAILDAAPQAREAYTYARNLAVTMWEKRFKQDTPEWKPCDDLIGVLTQIDNMVAGLVVPHADKDGGDCAKGAGKWPMLADLHLQALMFAYNEGYSKAYDGRVFPNPFSENGSQAAAWQLGTDDGTEARAAQHPRTDGGGRG